MLQCSRKLFKSMTGTIYNSCDLLQRSKISVEKNQATNYHAVGMALRSHTYGMQTVLN
jgi:hypothetical protein